jgi:hypothetical protein
MDAGDLGPSAKVSSPSGTCEDIASLTNHACGSMCSAARAGALYATDRQAITAGLALASGGTRSASEQQSRRLHVSSAKSARSVGRNRLHCETVTVTDPARG